MTRPFWINFLQTAALATAGSGVLAAMAATPGGGLLWAVFVDMAFWPLDGAPAPAFTAETRLLTGIFGGLTAGLGVMIFLLARGPIARGDRDSLTAGLAGVLTWFVVDSTASFAAGAPFNVAMNAFFLALLAGPMALLCAPAAPR